MHPEFLSWAFIKSSPGLSAHLPHPAFCILHPALPLGAYPIPYAFRVHAYHISHCHALNVAFGRIFLSSLPQPRSAFWARIQPAFRHILPFYPHSLSIPAIHLRTRIPQPSLRARMIIHSAFILHSAFHHSLSRILTFLPALFKLAFVCHRLLRTTGSPGRMCCLLGSRISSPGSHCAGKLVGFRPVSFMQYIRIQGLTAAILA
jgi:hypothetical protein